MKIEYVIHEVDLLGKKIRMTCFNDELPEGMPFELEMFREGDRYPEGERLDQVIDEHLPREAFAAKVRDRRPGGEGATPVDISARPDFTPPFAAEGVEKIYLSRSLNTIRTLQMPVELY